MGTMTGKGRELADMRVKRKVDILCVQETRWKGSKARNIGDGCKIFYHGEDGRRNGVGVIPKEDYIGRVLEVKRVSDRMMYRPYEAGYRRCDDDCDQCVCPTSGVLEGREGQVLDRSG